MDFQVIYDSSLVKGIPSIFMTENYNFKSFSSTIEANREFFILSFGLLIRRREEDEEEDD